MSHHTYLETVNKVLLRLREDAVSTLVSADDNVVLLVMGYVNDAKRVVEDAHAWNELNETWNETTTIGQHSVGLTNAGKYARIESIYGSDGRELTQQPLAYIRKQNAQGAVNDTPRYYAVDGVDANGDVAVHLFPTPKAAESLTIYGGKKTPVLVNDSDVLLVPSEPVFQLALAYAAAERGEVGGQPSQELMMVANQYLSNAIALDASLNLDDDVWYS